MRPILSLALVVGAALWIQGCESPQATGAGDDYPLEWKLQGQKVYDRHCAGCHGYDGDGKGPAAEFLDPKPRNFVKAVYKFRTTPNGYLPTDEDLMRTLTEGVHGTSMPSWRLLSHAERKAVLEYLKTFGERWKDPEEIAPAMALGGAPAFVDSPDSIRKGLPVYANMQCASCHGTLGDGVGAVATNLKDHMERPIEPLNFVYNSPKGGDKPEDYFRAFTTGLSGTPMPAYGDGMLNTEERWHLVSYVRALRKYKGKIPAEILGDDSEGSGDE